MFGNYEETKNFQSHGWSFELLYSVWDCTTDKFDPPICLLKQNVKKLKYFISIEHFFLNQIIIRSPFKSPLFLVKNWDFSIGCEWLLNFQFCLLNDLGIKSQKKDRGKIALTLRDQFHKRQMHNVEIRSSSLNMERARLLRALVLKGGGKKPATQFFSTLGQLFETWLCASNHE